MVQSDLLRSLKEVGDLPTIPSVAAQALALTEDPSSTASDLLRVVMTDPPLAAKVLRVANSVRFHGDHDVTDLQTAIVRLGFNQVRNLLMGVAVIRSFNTYFVGAPYTREDFWVHCISVGVLAAKLAGEGDTLPSSTAFVGGLLHDAGKLVLDRFAREPFTRSLRLAQSESMPLFKAERQCMGTDHAEVGAELLALWKFPLELTEPVRWHHEPQRCAASAQVNARAVEAADWLCNLHKVGYSGNPHPCRPPEEALKKLGITDARAKELIKSLEAEPLLSALLPV